MTPAFNQAILQLLASGGTIGGGMNPGAGLSAPAPVLPRVMPQTQAGAPTIRMTGNRPGAVGDPMDVRPPAARGEAGPAPAGPSIKGDGLGAKIGRYGSAASGGLSAVSSGATPWQAFGEALFGAIKSRRDTKMAEEKAATEAALAADERGYKRGRDKVSDEQWASRLAYDRSRDAVEDERWRAEEARKARGEEFANLKTAAEIEILRSGKPFSEKDIQGIIIDYEKALAGNSAIDPEDIPGLVAAKEASLRATNGGPPSIKDADRAPGMGDAGDVPLPGGAPKGDRGGPSIMAPPDMAEPQTTSIPKGAPAAAPAPAPAKKPKYTHQNPFRPKTPQDLIDNLQPGDIYLNPDDNNKPYRYNGLPATK